MCFWVDVWHFLLTFTYFSYVPIHMEISNKTKKDHKVTNFTMEGFSTKQLSSKIFWFSYKNNIRCRWMVLCLLPRIWVQGVFYATLKIDRSQSCHYAHIVQSCAAFDFNAKCIFHYKEQMREQLNNWFHCGQHQQHMATPSHLQFPYTSNTHYRQIIRTLFQTQGENIISHIDNFQHFTKENMLLYSI